ncbi:MAG: site-specific DNA-methyltransferase [Planctomycetaceae bacterium]|jgi:adenine-specific DNA-methyltransferase|nr:site-specific DNA-methyltransferase [Planctomycetaceae bacterium]
MTKQNSKSNNNNNHNDNKHNTNSSGLKFNIEHNQSVNANSELLDILKKVLPQFIDAEGNFKTDKFLAELDKNNIAESRDGYKLGFVGKDYARLQTGLNPESMIAPDVKHNSQKENLNSGNVFLTGDNLEVLRHLQNAYAGKIKMIYIDPPYNTGSDNFTYNDTFELSDEKLKSALGYSDEEIKRLKLIQGKSSHSAWLTFIYPRLKIARKLLTDDGAIFVSIDDNEQANLKLLMDDVFGEGNFRNTLLIRRRIKSLNSQFASNGLFSMNIGFEYTLVFAKSFDFLMNALQATKVKVSEKGRWDVFWSNADRPTMRYEILGFTPKTGQWRNSKEKADIAVENYKNYIEKFSNKISLEEYWQSTGRTLSFIRKIPNGIGKNGGIQHWIPPSDTSLRTSNWTDIEVAQIEKEINLPFNNPKSKIFLMELIKLSVKKTNDIILDFFAGSGTTAHAVMQLNAEDDGNRKFIMVQIDEPTPPDSEAFKSGYKTIDKIARERIKRAAKKIKTEKGLVLPEKFDGGFRHFRIVSPNVTILDKIEKFDPEQSQKDFFDNMVTQFDDKTTGAKGEEVILQTWLIHDGYTFDQQPKILDFEGYKAYYIDQSLLYIINQGWENKQTKKLLNCVGTHQLNLNTIIVYGYSFSMESLRELELGVKQSLSGQVLIEKRY